MEDRELLELAAKAAGILSTIVWSDWPDPDPICWIRTQLPCGANDDCPWNPIQDDGDAFRLLNRLCMDVHYYPGDEVEVVRETQGTSSEPFNRGDDSAALRRAIVRSAAEIGRNMP